MPAPTAVEPFRFEATYNTGDLEARARRRQPFDSPIADRWFVILAAIGLLCLFWPYTIALGAVVLATTTFVWGLREQTRAGRGRQWRVMDPPETVRVGASESGYWLEADGFSMRSSWARVNTYVEADGYVRVRGRQMATARFPVAQLKEAGVYDRIRAILDERKDAFTKALAAAAQPPA